jgi:phenylacetic acid degradation operon negative regulatory protein
MPSVRAARGEGVKVVDYSRAMAVSASSRRVRATSDDASAVLRPQSIMLTFLGLHVLGRSVAVSSRGYFDVFARMGVGVHATRSTLTRMAGRGLLARHRRGRQVYFGLTARSTAILLEGAERVQAPLDREWDGSWTLVAFSLPESWARQRHALRSSLMWGGFGLLQNGLWIAPSRIDVDTLIDDPDVRGRTLVFDAVPMRAAELEAAIREAYDLDGLSERYREFIARWRRRSRGAAGDPLARQLLLHTEWLALMRADPGLPPDYLPAGWPAARASELFHELMDAFAGSARELADSILDTIDVPQPR